MDYSEIMAALVEIRDSMLLADLDADDCECIMLSARKVVREAERMFTQRTSEERG